MRVLSSYENESRIAQYQRRHPLIHDFLSFTFATADEGARSESRYWLLGANGKSKDQLLAARYSLIAHRSSLIAKQQQSAVS
jgi:hypothetical protein